MRFDDILRKVNASMSEGEAGDSTAARERFAAFITAVNAARGDLPPIRASFNGYSYRISVQKPRRKGKAAGNF